MLPADPSELMTVQEVAEITRHDGDSVRRWIATGVGMVGCGRVKLSALRVGGRWFVRRDALDAFLTALNPDPTPVAESPAAFRRRALAEQAEALRVIGGEPRNRPNRSWTV